MLACTLTLLTSDSVLDGRLWCDGASEVKLCVLWYVGAVVAVVVMVDASGVQAVAL